MGGAYFDALTGQLQMIPPGTGGAGGWSALQCLYVGKHGNDANTGLDMAQAFQTFTAAIAAAAAATPSSSNQFVIWCEDAGVYSEAVAVPSWVRLFAPEATIGIGVSNNLVLGANSSAIVGTLRPFNTGAIGVIATAGPAQARIRRIEAHGGAYGVGHAGGDFQCVVDYIETDTSGLPGRAIRPSSGSGSFVCHAGRVWIPDAGYAVENVGIARAVVRIGEVQLDTSPATAVTQLSGADNLDVEIGRVRETAAGCRCFYIPGPNAGTVVGRIGEAQTTQDANVGPTSTLHAYFGKRSGTIVGGGDMHITEAGAKAHPTGYVWGFEYAPNAGSPGTQIDIQPGRCRNDADDSDISWTSTKTLNAAASGANGLDTGNLAPDTWYYIWAIGTQNQLANQSLLSLSPLNPTLPSGYTRKRLIGVARTDSVAFPGTGLRWLRVYGKGPSRKGYWTEESRASLEMLTAGNATSWAWVSLAPRVPPNSRRVELAGVVYLDDTDEIAELRPTGSAQGSPVWMLQNTGTNEREDWEIHIPCNDAQRVDYQVTTANDELWIRVQAFYFEI